MREVLEEFGVSTESTHKIVDELSKDKDKWVKFMMRFELGLETPDATRARKSAFNIGAAYIVGGMVPLSPYFFNKNSQQALLISIGVTLVALFIFGFLKAKAIGQNTISGAFKTTFIGALAAGVAYLLAKLIQGH